jgi:phosphoribosyl-ATP pyrophosphohydrolase
LSIINPSRQNNLFKQPEDKTMLHITELKPTMSASELLLAVKDIYAEEIAQTTRNLERGVYKNTDYCQEVLAGTKCALNGLEHADTMMADALVFADTYMLGDGMSDKFLFARLAKLSEEVGEMATAAAAGDEYEIADALVDIVYVALVTAAKRGHPFSKLWDDVHKSNMTKTPKGEGKFGASKGEGFIPADTKAIMQDAGF